MTPFEATLLTKSMDDLTGTLQRNRSMDIQERGMQSRDALDREALDLRRGDAADARANRKLGLEAQAAHQQRLEAIQKEGNETKRNQMYLEFLGELNKTGQLTDDGLSKMEEAFNKQFGAAGLGVKLFRQPPPTGAQSPQSWKHPETGEHFAYNPKTGAFSRSTKPGGGKRRVKPGELGGPPSVEIEQDLTAEELATAMREMQGNPDEEAVEPPDMEQTLRDLESGVARPAWGPAKPGQQPPAAAAPAPAAGGERVTVISPDGKRGSIPKAQLEQALKEGFKVAQ